MHGKNPADRGSASRPGMDAPASGPHASRRDLLRAGGALAASTGLLIGDAGAQGQARDADALERLVRAARDPRRRILLKGGTIITMDSAVGDLVRGDLLIEGKRIAAVDADLGTAQDANTIVVDA